MAYQLSISKETWSSLAVDLERELRVEVSKHRVALFALGIEPGNCGAQDLQPLFDDFDANDWHELFAIATAERVHTWIAHRLNYHSLGCPQALLDVQNELAARRRPWNRMIALATVEVVSRLQDAGIRVLTLKGAPLAKLLYGDELLRDMRDIDVLVNPAEVVEAASTLGRLGYRCDVNTDVLASELFQWCYRQVSLVGFNNTIEVDLHWKLSNAWLPCYQEMPLQRAISSTSAQYAIADVLGSKLPTLAATYLTLALKANISNSHRTELKEAVDLVRRLDLNESLTGAVSDVRRQNTANRFRKAVASVISASLLGRRITLLDLFSAQAGQVTLDRVDVWKRNIRRSLRAGGLLQFIATRVARRVIR